MSCSCATSSATSARRVLRYWVPRSTSSGTVKWSMWVISGGWSTMILVPPASVVVIRSRARSEVRRVAPFTVRRRTFRASAEACAFEPVGLDLEEVALQHRPLGHPGDDLPVARHRLARRLGDLGLGHPHVAPGQDDARRHPLHVPLPRADAHLVEVVEVEQHPPLGRGEQPEVGDVRIAADHDVVIGPRGVGQVGRHHRRRPPVVGEGRLQHPSDADRHQVGEAGGVLRLDDGHRVAVERAQLGLIPPSQRRSQPTAELARLGDGQTRWERQ